ncbi:MAG: zinc ribbon domain-containing protein [Gammaproteobacteria bacterium]|nr:zinc ribbon domain-containing protein [Gammaproteobacteria bacterium]
MPFYEYQCSACGHRHEELQKISDGRLRKCPDCGRNTLKRLVSAPVFRLKGGGWYETDFKGTKDNQRNLAGDREPVAEKPKEEKTAAADTASKPDAAKVTPPADKPKPTGDKVARSRKTKTRRRVRK